MDAVVNAAEALDWPAESIHVERFGAGPRKGDAPFVAVCQLSGKTVNVGATEHLLDCLEHTGIEVPFGCRAGSCGTCEVEVLAGKIIHRDTVQRFRGLHHARSRRRCALDLCQTTSRAAPLI
jgi:ferredoxin